MESIRSTVVLAFKNEVVSDVYALALEGVLSSKVIACTDMDSAIHVIGKHPDACLIVDANIPGMPIENLFRRQAVLAKRSRVIVLGGDKSLLPPDMEKNKVEFMHAAPQMAEVVAKVEAALRLEATAQQFCKITLKSLLIRSAKLRCDVYIRLSDDKFVKVLHANDRFDLEEYERFQHKNVNFLYLLRADFLVLMDDLLAKVAVLNSDPEKISMDEAVSASTAIFETVHAAFDTEGFTPHLRDLTVASVGLAINTIKKNPKLGELLERLDHNRDTFIGWHSTALSFLACKLATLLGWQSDSTFYKLSLAAMLHDLTLSSEVLAQIRTTAELNAAGVTKAEQGIVLRHPTDAAQLLSGFEEIPGEVGFIIEQHHEQQDGTGFPRGIDHNDINAISALFIIAHDIVTSMFATAPKSFQIEEFLLKREAEKIYTKGSFGQVFRSLIAKFKEA